MSLHRRRMSLTMRNFPEHETRHHIPQAPQSERRRWRGIAGISVSAVLLATIGVAPPAQATEEPPSPEVKWLKG